MSQPPAQGPGPAAAGGTSVGLKDALDLAIKLAKAGRIADAESVCTQILAQVPDQRDTLHVLGVIALQSGRAEHGVELIERAVARGVAHAAAFSNLGGGLKTLGRMDEALAAFDRALALDEGHAEAHNNRGIVLQALGRTEDALACYDRAIAVAPDMASAYYNRGNARRDLGDDAAALADYDRALELRPAYAEALNNRGNALNDLERLDEALESLDRAVAVRPGFAEAHNNRGIVLQALERYDEALTCYDRALELRPDYAEAHNHRGNALQDLERHEEALACHDRAIELKPDFADAHYNKGNALKDLNRVDEALACYEAAIALKTERPEAYMNRGNAQKELLNADAALASYDQAIALDPDDAEAHWNRSLCLLSAGHLEEGWRQYEWRKRRKKPSGARTFPQPPWTGAEDLTGRTLFLHWEQGLGDTIQFCRYAPLAAARGARVVLAVQAPLRRLMAGLGAGIEVVGEDVTPAAFDFHSALLSMPLAFGTVRETIPAEIPYLAAEPDRVAAWRVRLGTEGFRVGLCWQGSTGKIDAGRSFPLASYRGLASVPGVRLISLQKGTGAEQLAELPPGMEVETLGDDFDSGPDAFLDTAAVMESLDLVITSDTSIAHVAGALGRPVWIALKQVPDFRWQLQGATTPWYPTARLFRQSRRNDWAPVFAEIEAELRALVAR